MTDRYQRLRKLPKEQIASKLKGFRQQYNYTQEALAVRIGVGRITLLRWENEQVRISNVMLKALINEGIL